MPREAAPLANKCISQKCTRRAAAWSVPRRFPSLVGSGAGALWCRSRRGHVPPIPTESGPVVWPLRGVALLPLVRGLGLSLHGWPSRLKAGCFGCSCHPRQQGSAAVSARRNAKHFVGQLPVQSRTPEGFALGLSTSTKEMQ